MFLGFFTSFILFVLAICLGGYIIYDKLLFESDLVEIDNVVDDNNQIVLKYTFYQIYIFFTLFVKQEINFGNRYLHLINCYGILVIVVLRFGKDGAMHMEKRIEAAFLGYFAILLLVVITSIVSKIDIVSIGYLVVVLSCVLKFILIVNESKK